MGNLKRDGKYPIPEGVVESGSAVYVPRQSYHSKNSDHQQIYDKYVYRSVHERYAYEYSVALIPLSPLSYHTISPHKHHN